MAAATPRPEDLLAIGGVTTGRLAGLVGAERAQVHQCLPDVILGQEDARRRHLAAGNPRLHELKEAVLGPTGSEHPRQIGSPGPARVHAVAVRAVAAERRHSLLKRLRRGLERILRRLARSRRLALRRERHAGNQNRRRQTCHEVLDVHSHHTHSLHPHKETSAAVRTPAVSYIVPAVVSHPAFTTLRCSVVLRQAERDELGVRPRPGGDDDVLLAAMHVGHRRRRGKGVELDGVDRRASLFVEHEQQPARRFAR